MRQKFSLVNANARSLGPKLESLIDCFDEAKLDFAFVTETWLQESARVDFLDNMATGHNLSFICRNRQTAASNGRQYGGVAIISRDRITSLKEFRLANPENYEIVAAHGRVHGVTGKAFCIAHQAMYQFLV